MGGLCDNFLNLKQIMEKKKYIHWSYNSGAGFIKLCSEVVKETASHYTVIFTQSGMTTDVAKELVISVG